MLKIEKHFTKLDQYNIEHSIFCSSKVTKIHLCGALAHYKH